MQLVGYSWTGRGPKTKLAEALIDHVHAKSLEDLLRGYTTYEYRIEADAARIVFEVAKQGDDVAQQLIWWAGVELGEMANAVIRQLDFQHLEFDVVMTGSMFEGGSMLIDPMRETIIQSAPKAQLVRLNIPPVIGAAVLGMEGYGLAVTLDVRNKMKESIVLARNQSVR
jgi:N-acetylglucosamine kinase-like BadF-type ATPase